MTGDEQELEAGGPDATARLAARVAARVARTHLGRGLDEVLAGIAGNDLTTLLLHALRQRARRRSPGELVRTAEVQRMVQAAPVDARRMHAFDGAGFAAAAGFDAVELAPVTPLGTAACTGVDPNNVLMALRAVEIPGDPTPALALHAARRRRRGQLGAVRLVASQRVMRLQPIDHPDFSPHFRLFALTSVARAARAGDDDACERRLVLEQLEVWATLLAMLPAAGFAVAGLRVVLSDTRLVAAALRAAGHDAHQLARQVAAHRLGSADAALAVVAALPPRDAHDAGLAAAQLGLPAREQAIARAWMAEVAAPLRARHPAVPVTFDFARLQGLAYYQGPLIALHVRHDDGRELAMGDGGAVGWGQALLDDRRERMIATGLGSELLVKLFDRPVPTS